MKKLTLSQEIIGREGIKINSFLKLRIKKTTTQAEKE